MLPGGLQGQLPLLRPDGKRAPCSQRMGAGGATGTGSAVGRGARDVDDLGMALIDGGRPADAGRALRTGGLVLVLVNEEAAGGNPAGFTGLPGDVAMRGNEQFDVKVPPARHE